MKDRYNIIHQVEERSSICQYNRGLNGKGSVGGGGLFMVERFLMSCVCGLVNFFVIDFVCGMDRK